MLGTFKAAEIGEVVELPALLEERLYPLAKGFWEEFRATPPLPFDPEGLRNAFHDNRRTVGKSLQTLAFMIDSKLTAYPGNGSHPVDQGLSFDETQIRNFIRLFDRGTK